ncbi:MAG TPA: PilN domain-containing protein [Longimicrobiales bacterium]
MAVEIVRRFGVVRPGRAWTRALDATGMSAGRWPALGAALEELGQIAPIAGATVHVALLHPFGRTKVLRVPPVRRSELRALVGGGIRRFFLDAPSAGFADARRLRGAGAPARALAAVADTGFVEAVIAELDGAGCRVGGVTTAVVALVEAALCTAPALRRGTVELGIVDGDWRERVRLEDGEPREVHPVPSVAAPGVAGDAEPRAASAGAGGADVRIALGPEGAELPGARGLAREPAALAAFGAALLAGAAPQLVPEQVRETWRRRSTRRTARLAAAAAALAVAACGAYAWGLARELESVRAARRAIGSQVARALEARDAVGVVRAHLEAIAQAEAGRHAWAERLATLTAALPDSAHLWTFAADGGTLRIEGLAESASAVVLALDSSDWFRDVELAAPVVRVAEEPRERFTVAAVVEEPATGGTDGTSGAPPPRPAAPAPREGL